MAEKRFISDKARVLKKADLSRKGSVDEGIRSLVEFINCQCSYYTTSSCSGRMLVFDEGKGKRKKGCNWLLVSHDPIDLPELASCLGSTERSCSQEGDAPTYTFLKFEAFILHVACRSWLDAQIMLQVATGSGFRNSGISCGRKERIILAVRSTLTLEAPVAFLGKLIVTQEYLHHLVELVKVKMKENTERTNRFFTDLRRVLDQQRKMKVQVGTFHPHQKQQKNPEKITKEVLEVDNLELEHLFLQ